jgi:hypothetical protein
MVRLSSVTLPAERHLELERHIQHCTGRRVRGLCVEVGDEQIVLRGRTSSYYIKQLAQHCIRDVLPEVRLANDIVVE